MNRQSIDPTMLPLLVGILDGSPNGIVTYQPIRDEAGVTVDYQTVYANDKATELLGYEESDFYQKTLFERFPDGRQLHDQYMPLIAQNQPFINESYFKKAQRWVETQARPLGEGFFLVLRDITVQKQAQLDLAAQTDRLAAIFESSLNGIIAMQAIRDDTGDVVDFLIDAANNATLAMTGRTPAEIIGTRLMITFPGNKEAGFLAVYQRVIGSGTPERITRYYQDKNGLEAWFEVSAVRQGADRLVVTFSDVTLAEQTQKQLRESNQSLEQFAGVASHDLQEPLRKIQSFGSLLADEFGEQLGESGQDMIRRMQGAANRMSVLIRDLLTYSRLSSQPETPELVNLNVIIAEVLADLEIQIADQQAVIDVPELPQINGTALALRQLFQNLIGNGLKFYRPGITPHIQIEVSRVDARNVPTPSPASRTASYWAIRIADNGIGFDLAYKEQIFGAFQRLHSRNSPYAGTGVGLSIVKKVIEQHQGAIEAHSTPGEGATFTVYLPA